MNYLIFQVLNRILLVVNCGDEILEAMGQSLTLLQALQASGGFDNLHAAPSLLFVKNTSPDYLNLCRLGTRAQCHAFAHMQPTCAPRA